MARTPCTVAGWPSGKVARSNEAGSPGVASRSAVPVGMSTPASRVGWASTRFRLAPRRASRWAASHWPSCW
ncbi:hypothetical protein [Achromobacter xylosoxidans]|uniref:hypothetical protein n=1 Tax=Alcaligenes xylosoxydans xylosoxydans TaxID=85698 RepID=UPI0038FCAE50